jgi:hypothetical protein
VLQPVRVVKSKTLRAPSLTACLMADSVTALQIQMYMAQIPSAAVEFA